MLGQDGFESTGDVFVGLFPGGFPPLAFPSFAHAQERGQGPLPIQTLGKGSPALGTETSAHATVMAVAFDPDRLAAFNLHGDRTANSAHPADTVFGLFHVLSFLCEDLG